MAKNVLWQLNDKVHGKLKNAAKEADSTLPLVAQKVLAAALGDEDFMGKLTFGKAKRRGRKPSKDTKRTRPAATQEAATE